MPATLTVSFHKLTLQLIQNRDVALRRSKVQVRKDMLLQHAPNDADDKSLAALVVRQQRHPALFAMWPSYRQTSKVSDQTFAHRVFGADYLEIQCILLRLPDHWHSLGKSLDPPDERFQARGHPLIYLLVLGVIFEDFENTCQLVLVDECLFVLGFFVPAEDFLSNISRWVLCLKIRDSLPEPLLGFVEA